MPVRAIPRGVYPLTFDAGSRLSAAGSIHPMRGRCVRTDRDASVLNYVDHGTSSTVFTPFDDAQSPEDRGQIVALVRPADDRTADQVIVHFGGTGSRASLGLSGGNLRLEIQRATTNLIATVALTDPAFQIGSDHARRWLWLSAAWHFNGVSGSQTLAACPLGCRFDSNGTPTYATQQVGSGAVTAASGERLTVGDRSVSTSFAFQGDIAVVGLWDGDGVTAMRDLGNGNMHWGARWVQHHMRPIGGPVLFTRYFENLQDLSGNANHGSPVSLGQAAASLAPAPARRIWVVPDVRQPVKAGARKSVPTQPTGIRTNTGGSEGVRLDHHGQAMLNAGGITLAAWFKWDGTAAGFEGLMAQRVSGGAASDETFLMFQDNGTSVLRRLRCQFDLSTTAADAQTSDNFLAPAGVWQFGAATWDGNTGGSGPRLWRLSNVTGWAIEEETTYAFQQAGSGSDPSVHDRPIILGARSSNAAAPGGSSPFGGDSTWHAVIHRELSPKELRLLALQPLAFAAEAPVLWSGGKNHGRLLTGTTYVGGARPAPTMVPVINRDWHWSAAPLGVEPAVQIGQCARPASDVQNDGWTREGGETNNLFLSIDESSPDPKDFVQSPL